MRHLPNTILQPLTENELKKYGMTSEYKDTPKLHYQVIVCCSLINSQHPGYYPLSMDSAGEYRTAKIILHRLFQENPLLHSEKWPYDFTNIKPGQTWTTTTFKELKETDVLQFPRINRDQINPTAVELSGSVHALQKADGILTYMKQLLMKDKNLTREEAKEELNSPPDDWKLQYVRIETPPDFVPTPNQPKWEPEWWEPEFGQWNDITLVRCKIPPSNRCVTSANYHYPVIAFGKESSGRLMARSPYDVIYFWRCFRCPSKSGSISMDRHVAALLKMLSFNEEYRSTAKTVNILNTVAPTKRQTTRILPNIEETQNIPDYIPRKSRNTRLKRKGVLNPIYDPTHQTAPSPVQQTGSDGDSLRINTNLTEGKQHMKQLPTDRSVDSSNGLILVIA